MTKLTFLKLNILALLLLFFVGVKANHSNELKKLEERLAQANDPNEKINALYELSKLIVHSDAEQAVDYSKEALQLGPAICICQCSIIHDLQQNIINIGMSLFDLIKQ